MEKKHCYWGKTLLSFLVVLFTMPLGHAMMMLMNRLMSPEAVHYAGFLMGLAGFIIVIMGVFVKGDTRQTLFGLFGGLLFLDGMGRVSFSVLCQPLRHSAGDTERGSGHTSRIPHPARYLRTVDDGDDALYLLYTHRLQLHQLVAEVAVWKTQDGDCRPSNDASRIHRNVHGTEHDPLDELSLAHVLL